MASGCASDGKSSTGVDLHSDPGIIIRASNSHYEETIKISADWDAQKSYRYTLDCESSSIERLLKFLYRGADFSDPKVYGSENIPSGLYCVSFPQKEWKSKEDANRDITEALKVAFNLDVAINPSSHSIEIRNRK